MTYDTIDAVEPLSISLNRVDSDADAWDPTTGYCGDAGNQLLSMCAHDAGFWVAHVDVAAIGFARVGRGPFVEGWDGAAWSQMGGELEATWDGSRPLADGDHYLVGGVQIKSDGSDVYVLDTFRIYPDNVSFYVAIRKWDGIGWALLQQFAFPLGPDATWGGPVHADASGGAMHALVTCPDALRYLNSSGDIVALPAGDTVTSPEHHMIRADTGRPVAFYQTGFDTTRHVYTQVRMVDCATGTILQTLRDVDSPIPSPGGIDLSGVSKRVFNPGSGPLYYVIVELGFEALTFQVPADGTGPFANLDGNVANDEETFHPSGDGGAPYYVPDVFAEPGNLWTVANWINSYISATSGYAARVTQFTRDCVTKEWRQAVWASVGSSDGPMTIPTLAGCGAPVATVNTLGACESELVGNYIYVAVTFLPEDPFSVKLAKHQFWRWRICRGCGSCGSVGLHVWRRF